MMKIEVWWNRLFSWWYLFSISNESRNRYQVSMISYLLSQIVKLGGVIIIWYIALQNNTIIPFQQIFTYYLIGEIFIFEPSPHLLLETEIVSGKLADRILKPVSVWKSLLVEYTGRYFTLGLTKVIIGIIVGLVGFSNFLLPASPTYTLLFILSCIISYLINLYLSYVIGFSAFFFGYVYGIAELIFQIKYLLSGKMFPLNIITQISFLIFSPLALTYYLPLQIYFGSFSIPTTLGILGLGIATIIILHVVATLIYKRGLRRFESVGI